MRAIFQNRAFTKHFFRKTFGNFIELLLRAQFSNHEIYYDRHTIFLSKIEIFISKNQNRIKNLNIFVSFLAAFHYKRLRKNILKKLQTLNLF